MSSLTPASALPEIAYWIAFSYLPIVGPVRWRQLLEVFPNLEAAWAASVKDFLEAGVAAPLAERIVAARKGINPARTYEQVQRLGIDAVTYQDEKFPPLLLHSPTPPPLLFSRGQFNWQGAVPIAIVGTRKPTLYGQRAAEYLASELSAAGATIVSGLAFGIDSLAHAAAVHASGTTIGVLGCGLDHIYPRSNQQLGDEIIASGGQIISTFPPGTPPLKHHFPLRNRIIAGSSLGVVVVEAAERSGALSTAAAAIEHNREVFTVPGSIFSDQSAGTHALLRAGATPVRTAQDVLDVLAGPLRSPTPSPRPTPTFATAEEAKIYALLSTEPIHIDTLIKHSQLSSSVVGATITLFEVQGLVRHLGGQQYTKL